MAERINIGKFINNLDTEDLSSEKLQGVVNNVYAKAIKDKRTRDKKVADATKDQGTELVRFVKSNHDRLKAHGSKIEKDIDKDDAKIVEPKGEVSESLSEAAVSPFPDRSIFNKVRGYEKQHLPSGFTFADVDTMRRIDRIGGKSPEDMCDIIKAEIYYGSEDGRELCTEKTYKVFDDGRVEEISQLANEEEPVEEAYIRKEIGSKELWGYINQILKRSYRRLEDEDGIIDPYDIAQILENKYDISGYDNNVTHLVEDIVDALHWWGKDELSKYNLQLKQAPDNDYYLVPTGFEFEESLKEEKAKKASENTKRMWTSIAARRKGLPSFSKWVEEQGYDIDEVDDDKKLSDELRSKYREFVRSNKSLKENAKPNVRPCSHCGADVDLDDCDTDQYWTNDGDRVVYHVCPECGDSVEETQFDESLKEAKNDKRWWVLFFDETGHNRAGSEWSHAFNTPPIATERRILAPDYVKPKGAVGYMILSDSEFNALDYDEIDKNYKRWGKKLPINESLELNEDSREERERWYQFRDQIESYLKAQGLIYHRSTYENPYWRFTRRGNTPILRWMFTRSGFDWMLARGTDYYDRYNSFARGEVDFEKSELFGEDGSQKVFEKIKPELDRAIELGRRYLKDLRDGTVAFPYGTAAEAKDESLELKEESNNTRVLVSSLVVDAPKAVKRIRYGSSPWHTKYFDRDEYDTDEAWVEAATTFYRRKIRDAAAAYKTYDPDQSYDFRFGSPFARVVLAACYGSHRKQRLLSEDKYQVGDGEFTNGSTPNLDKWIADGYLVRQAFNSDKRVPLLQVTAGGSGAEVEEALNGQGSFSFIDTQSGQKFGPYDTIGIATNKANQYGGPGLVIIDNTNRKWYRLANGKALPMGTIPAGFDLGEEAGAAKKAKNNTICEEDDRFAEQKARWEELSDRIKVIEFDNGDYYYIDVDWEKGTIFAGSATNTGVLREFEINLDPDLNIDENIAELYDYIVNQRPDLIGDQFEEDLQEAQATGDKPQANPNFNKEKFGKYFDDKGQLKPELRDEYFKAVRVDKQNARRGKRGMPFNKIVR